MKKIPENIMVIIRAVVPLAVIIVLFIALTQIGIGKISQVRSQISEARHNQAVLTEKLDLLRTVAVTGVQDSNTAVASLPDTSPTLSAMSQLKTLAADSNVVLRSLKSTGSNETFDLNNVQISFNIVGTKDAIENFLTGIKTFAPITILDTVKVSQSGDSFLGNIGVRSYWAALPTKLPSSIEQFNDLTADDKLVLSNLDNLTKPAFLTLPPPSGESKQDPFVQ